MGKDGSSVAVAAGAGDAIAPAVAAAAEPKKEKKNDEEEDGTPSKSIERRDKGVSKKKTQRTRVKVQVVECNIKKGERWDGLPSAAATVVDNNSSATAAGILTITCVMHFCKLTRHCKGLVADGIDASQGRFDDDWLHAV
ncbi:hypothetical protein L1987_43966 [Smallanthus sonchifolius]|uniref:Uncharacterized protein n=1 Tax=Smallanthus sonchifolius TaxID=185202 RepID=A0ACB9GMY6_9ASTR|nr:hypothetical protein L1987_43966 [Smallanthus sonchifolius]